MKVTVEDVSNIKKKITVIVPKDAVNTAVEDAYTELNKKAKIKGFRPGKVPRHLLKSMFRDQVRADVTEKLFGETYAKALDEAGIHPVSYPEVDTKGVTEDEEFTYSAAVEVVPKIELGDYKDIVVERLKITSEEKDVDAFIKRLVDSHSTLEPELEDRPIKEGDIVTVSFEGSQNGKPIKDTKAENYPVEIGGGRFIEDFEKNLIGKKPGQHLEFDVTFPEDYHVKELAGKPVTFQADVKEIRVKKVPAIDDEFAKDIGEFETLASLKQDIKKRLESTASGREDQSVKQRILKKLVEKNPVDAPAALVEIQAMDIIRDTEMKMRSQGMSLEMMGAKPEEMMETVKPRAEFEVKARLILEEIARHESITTTKEEAEDRLKQDAEAVRMKFEDIKKRYDKNDAWEDLTSRMTEEKTLDFLVKLVTIKEVKKLSKEFQDEEEVKEEK
jgi:trigger factor